MPPYATRLSCSHVHHTILFHLGWNAWNSLEHKYRTGEKTGSVTMTPLQRNITKSLLLDFVIYPLNDYTDMTQFFSISTENAKVEAFRFSSPAYLVGCRGSFIHLQYVRDHGGDVVASMRLPREEHRASCARLGLILGMQLEEVGKKEVKLLVHLAKQGMARHAACFTRHLSISIVSRTKCFQYERRPGCSNDQAANAPHA